LIIHDVDNDKFFLAFYQAETQILSSFNICDCTI
jgi:hypothetical protein